MKLAPDSHFPKILTVIENYWAPAEIDGDMAVFPRKQMAEKITKLPTFFNFALQYLKHGKDQYVCSPKIGPKGAFWPKNENFA